MPTVISESAGGYTGTSGSSAPASFAVVRVPFPFIDRMATKNRPALVLSDAVRFNVPAGQSVLAMITSAGNPPWPLDCEIRDREAAGLPAPSKLRMKLFTLDNRRCGARSGTSRSPMSGGCGRRWRCSCPRG
jgi:mRNA interferase MazF